MPRLVVAPDWTHQELIIPSRFLLLEVTPRPAACSRTCHRERLRAALGPGPCSKGLFGEQSYSLTADGASVMLGLHSLRGRRERGSPSRPRPPLSHTGPPSLSTPTLELASTHPHAALARLRADRVTSHRTVPRPGGQQGQQPQTQTQAQPSTSGNNLDLPAPPRPSALPPPQWPLGSWCSSAQDACRGPQRAGPWPRVCAAPSLHPIGRPALGVWVQTCPQPHR